MSPAQYTKLAAQLATTHDVLERLQHCVKPANSPGLIADVVAMQGIVARMARNSWALMDEAQQCQTAMTVAHIKETAADL